MLTILDENNKLETSYVQMSDELYRALAEYLKDHDLSFSQFCKDLRVEEYMMRKIVDRNIAMYSPYRLLKRISKVIGAEDIPIWQDPFKIKAQFSRGIKKRTTL